MKVAQLPPQLPQLRESKPAPAPPAGFDEGLQADNFSFDFPSVAVADTAAIYALPDEAAPKLDRPVLLVHGFCGKPSNWSNMQTWLTQGGQNKDGGVVSAQGGNIASDAKVFTMEFSRPFNPVSNNAAELRQAIDRIARVTGAEEIDVVSHSMGGLDTRLYLDQGDEKVKNLVMIATPNHGSVLADLELTFRELGLPIKPPTDDPLVRQALRDLSEVRGNNNPLLSELNRNWDRQKSRADMHVIAGNGTPTLANRFSVTLRGDGTVPRKSAKMPDTPLHNVWWTSHGPVKDHPETLKLTGAILAGQPLPAAQEDPPNIPPDRDIVPQEVQADREQLHYVLAN